MTYKHKIIVLILLCGIGLIVYFRLQLHLLFIPDPVKGVVYEYPVPGGLLKSSNIILNEGFAASSNGLSLLPGTSGRIIFNFNKKQMQGCLLRVWLYGDRGEERRNALSVSVDDGASFRSIAASDYHIGSVFDITEYVQASDTFQLLCEASNNSPCAQVALERLQVIITDDIRPQPGLPDMSTIIDIFLCLFLCFYFLLKKECTLRTFLQILILQIIIMLAVYLRWQELTRISGTLLDLDTIEYAKLAQKMNLFSDSGFYSAAFGIREPLYLFIVKTFYTVFGASDTHIRFVSFTFSIAAVLLTYIIGKEWFNGIVGLAAAFILACHPYCISLSARGLREEWFTVLVLLLTYFIIKKNLFKAPRTFLTGAVAGFVFLTRCEFMPVVAFILLLLPLLLKSLWSWRMSFGAILLGMLLVAPHLYNMYRTYGNPLYSLNMHARFYANAEFMDTPGFPSRQEIEQKGMYTGPNINFYDFYFKMHTSWQLIRNTVAGFAKVSLKMPLQFAFGKGQKEKVKYLLHSLKKNPTAQKLADTTSLLLRIFCSNFMSYSTAGILVLIFSAGIYFMVVYNQWSFLLFFIILQVQVSFLAYIGLDPRITMHVYPFSALCCGYALYCFVYRKNIKKKCTCSSNE